ncbi:phage scaffolding protein [Clostridium disporicum]|uniref:phage scaffolding protein n=2 Tax=Clostridium TaxID=1485 RepID=UPI0006C08B27|nr:phage scaffolding protein [Clostridium disporicum]CUN37178.1 minor structural GP20 protein [Clostridium disporicum]
MKRDFLKGLGLDDSIIDQIMDENGKDIQREKNAVNKVNQDLEKYKAENEGLKTQLSEANTQIQSFKEMDIDGIKASAEEWKTKYETDTKALNEKIAAKDYDYAIKDFMSNYKFIDDDVKETVINKFKAKEFKLEEGKFLGGEDFMKEYKENHKSLFISDEPQDPIPEIVKPTGGSNPSGDANPFKFNFMGVRPVNKE